MRLKTLVFLAFLAGCCAFLLLLKDDQNENELPSAKRIEHPLTRAPDERQAAKGSPHIHFPSYPINFDALFYDDIHIDWTDRAKMLGQKLPQVKINGEFFHPNSGPPYFPFATPSNSFMHAIGGGNTGGYFLGRALQQNGGFFGLVIPTPAQLSNEATTSQPTVTQPPPTTPGGPVLGQPPPTTPGGPVLGQPPPLGVPDIETYFTLATLLILSYILRSRRVRMDEERS